ncbi:MAG: glycosyltransferase family 2 protein [Patescibacteria group bacterium]
MSELFRWGVRTSFKIEPPVSDIVPEEVAIMVPAHNEELVIRDTIESLLLLVPASNIFVISDASQDKTVSIVESMGAQVLDLKVSHGKAGALRAGIDHFNLLFRFKAITFVDADTRLRSDYLKNALPLFADKKVVAVAGYAKTIWNPKKLSWTQKLFILHRDRVYFLSQRFIKFGQTTRFANVTHIIPGFASIYRAKVPFHIDMNPPGLVIEDFNMTFEVHHKHLGIIAHHPSVVAYTQDPDNKDDYFRQIKRWHLGLWQTVRFHGLWPSLFSASLILTLFELVLGNFILLYAPVVLFFGIIPGILAESPSAVALGWAPTLLVYSLSPIYFFTVVGVMWCADYVLTIITAVCERRASYLFFGLAFPFVRILDAVAFLGAIPRAFSVHSSGRWVSPTRRAG